MKIIISLSLIILMQYLHAEPVVDEKYNYYPVKVTELRLLLESLNMASQIKEDGDIYHAHTKTYVNWTFNWKRNKDGCRIVESNTEVEVSYTLPKLVQGKNNPELKNIWERYYKSLLTHEKGHADIAVKAAKAIEVELDNFPSYSNCTTLESDANKKAAFIIGQYIPQHKLYDIETEHGKTQGAYIGDYIDQ